MFALFIFKKSKVTEEHNRNLWVVRLTTGDYKSNVMIQEGIEQQKFNVLIFKET